MPQGFFHAESQGAASFYPQAQKRPLSAENCPCKSAPEPIANDNELADMVYVPGFGWIQSEDPNHVEYAEDMYENGNKIGTMG